MSEAPPLRRRAGLRPDMVWKVAWRDLLSTLRDRRTLTSTVLVPLLIIPVFTLGMPYLLGRLVGGQAETRQKVGVVGTLPAELRAQLQADEQAPASRAAGRAGAGTSPRSGVELVSVSDPRAAVLSGAVDAAIQAGPLPQRAGDGQGTVQVYAKLSSLKGQTGAYSKVQDTVEAYNHALTLRRLRGLGLSEAALTPVVVRPVNVSPPQEQKSGQLAFLIPMLMLQFILTGAMATALDATAGEKERGTLESLLVSPVRRGEVVAGKLLSTTLTALVTASFSLIGFLAAGAASGVLLRGMDPGLTGAIGGQLTLTAPGLLALSGIVLSAALVISGLLIALGIYARSYKEAQTYVAPLSLLIVLPAVGLQFSDFLTLGDAVYAVPLFGSLVGILDIVRGHVTAGHALAAIAANLLGALLLGAVALRSFGREEVIFRN